MKAGALIAGKYRLARPIGKGAMGTVWEATHEGTSRQVAIKLILEPTDELRHRLIREARAYGALRHRNIVEVLDVGQTEEGDPFLVMQLLTGETLADRLLRQRRLSVPEATRIARDVARALAAAHVASIIHRDLKPANIFLHDEPGEEMTVVKVVDFGVSKNLLASDGLATVAGGMVGSPAYMSPEQAGAGAHGPVDHRADLWSLGVVLFEMLTGVRPLQGDSTTILPQIVSAEIPLVTTFVRTIDPRLAALVARCLDRDLSRRVASAADLAVQLQSYTTANHGSGASSLVRSGSGSSLPVVPPSRSDPAALASPRGPIVSAPERETSAAVLASPRAGIASISEQDPSVRSPRPQDGLPAGPTMPDADDDDNQATAKLSLDVLRALKPAVQPAPPRMSPRAGATVPMQSNPALPPCHAPLPGHDQPAPAAPSFKETLPLQGNPVFGSEPSWAAPIPTAKLDPSAPWVPEQTEANGGTTWMSTEDRMKLGSSGAEIAPPPAPPPPVFSSISATSSSIQQSGGDPSSTSGAAALQQRKRRRTRLLVVGAAAGVTLATLAVMVLSPKSGEVAAPSGSEVAATESTSVAAVIAVPSSAEPEIVPSMPSASPSAGPVAPAPRPVVKPNAPPPNTKRSPSGAPAPSARPSSKLPTFLDGYIKKKTSSARP